MNGRWVGFIAVAGLALGLSAAAQQQSQACPMLPGGALRVSAAFGMPMSEAAKLIKDGNFKAASLKVEEAAPHAFCDVERDAIARYRVAIAANLGYGLPPEAGVYITETPPENQ